MNIYIITRTFQIREDLGAVLHHPRGTVLERERRKTDDELSEVMGCIEDLHARTYARLGIVHDDDVGITHILEIELDDLVGAVDFPVAERPAHGIEKAEFLSEELLGLFAPFTGDAVVLVHDGTAQVYGFHGFLVHNRSSFIQQLAYNFLRSGWKARVTLRAWA